MNAHSVTAQPVTPLPSDNLARSLKVARPDDVEFKEVEVPQSYYPAGGSPRESWRTLYYANLTANFASEVLGVSARKMLDALISGTHDPEVLADLAKGALRKKIPALREALQGRFTGHHALLVGQMLAQIDFLDETIATLSARVMAFVVSVSSRFTFCRSRCAIAYCWRS